MGKKDAENVCRLVFSILVVSATFTFLVVGLRHAKFVSAQESGASKKEQRPKPGPENNYFFSEHGPAGDWLFESADMDIAQAHDPNNPVVIAGIRSYVGKGNWRKHLMIESIVLKNRTSKTIRAFKLGWIIMSAEDHRAGKNREAALLEGETDFIEPGFTNFGGRTKPFFLEVLKAAKPLIKDGVLNGTFAIRIRLTQIQFEDGSRWLEGQPVARRLKYSHHKRAGPLQLPSNRCENSQCNFHADGQGYCAEVNLEGFHCDRHDFTYDPPNSQEPDAWYCDSYVCSECQDKDNDGWYDCENDCDDTANSVFAFAKNPMRTRCVMESTTTAMD